MTPDFMSSDYSESDGDNLLTRPLHWRATRVSDFLSQLDQAADELKVVMSLMNPLQGMLRVDLPGQSMDSE